METYSNGKWVAPPHQRLPLIAAGERKYLPSLADLIDRLSIDLIKCIKDPDHRDIYNAEIERILHDIDNDSGLAIFIQAVVVLAQANLHIWQNESDVRAGSSDPSKLTLTHRINGIRNQAKNVILDFLNTDEGKDYKIDCLADDAKEYRVNWYKQLR